jgi:hypothetical protein
VPRRAVSTLVYRARSGSLRTETASGANYARQVAAAGARVFVDGGDAAEVIAVDLSDPTRPARLGSARRPDSDALGLTTDGAHLLALLPASEGHLLNIANPRCLPVVAALRIAGEPTGAAPSGTHADRAADRGGLQVLGIVTPRPAPATPARSSSPGGPPPAGRRRPGRARRHGVERRSRRGSGRPWPPAEACATAGATPRQARSGGLVAGRVSASARLGPSARAQPEHGRAR